MKTMKWMAVVLISVLLACTRETEQTETLPVSHKGTVKITGAHALTPLTEIWITEFTRLHPEYSFSLQPNGSNRGLQDILNGNADISMVSSEVPPEIDSQLWIAPVARMAVVPIINAGNPWVEEIRKKGMTREQLATLFSGSGEASWGGLFGKPGKDPVHVLVRNDSAGATDVFARFLWINPDGFRGKGVNGDREMIQSVQKDPLAIGYCNFIYAIDPSTGTFAQDIRIIPLDLNFNGRIEPKEDFYDSIAILQRAMWTGKFPCGLTRSLSFALKGRPETREEIEFLKWILTDGQRLIPRLGYIELHTSENVCRVYFLSQAGK